MFFKKKVGGSYSVTCVTKLKKIVLSTLLEHFWLLQNCYIVLQNEIIVYYQRFWLLHRILRTAKKVICFVLKKYTYPFF